MRFRQCAAYFQFLADRKATVRSDNLQQVDASGSTAANRDEVQYLSEVDAALAMHQFGQFFLRIRYFPAVEVCCFLIVVVQYLAEDFLVGCIAECFGCGTYPFLRLFFLCEVREGCFAAVAQGSQVGVGNRFPAMLELLGDASATF